MASPIERMPTSANPGDLMRARVAYCRSRRISVRYSNGRRTAASASSRANPVQPRALCQVRHGRFAGLQHFVAVRQLELVGKCLRQTLVHTLRSFHSVTILRFVWIAWTRPCETLAFGVEHLTAQRSEPVVAAASVVQFGPRALARLFNEFRLDHAFQRAVKRCRPQADLAHGAIEDFLHDAVAMLLFARKGEQDVEPLGF